MKRLLLLCLALTAMCGAHAQLTLDECRALAREHYPEIRQYDLIRRSADYSLSNARRAWLPRLSLTAQATWQTDVPGFPEQMTGDRKSTRLNSSHDRQSRMPSSA